MSFFQWKSLHRSSSFGNLSSLIEGKLASPQGFSASGPPIQSPRTKVRTLHKVASSHGSSATVMTASPLKSLMNRGMEASPLGKWGCYNCSDHVSLSFGPNVAHPTAFDRKLEYCWEVQAWWQSYFSCIKSSFFLVSLAAIHNLCSTDHTGGSHAIFVIVSCCQTGLLLINSCGNLVRSWSRSESYSVIVDAEHCTVCSAVLFQLLREDQSTTEQLGGCSGRYS